MTRLQAATRVAPPAEGDHVTPPSPGDDRPVLAETGSEALLGASAARCAVAADGTLTHR